MGQETVVIASQGCVWPQDRTKGKGHAVGR